MKKPRVIDLPRKRRIIITDSRQDARTFADQAFVTNLSASVIAADGSVKSQLDLGSGTITTAGVLFVATDWTLGTSDISNLKYVASGTDATASGTANTALGTPIGTTASTATLTLGTVAGNATVTAVATISYSGTYAVTEFGLISQATISGATLFDRKTFAAINVVSGDSIQWTYTLTLSSGG